MSISEFLIPKYQLRPQKSRISAPLVNEAIFCERHCIFSQV